MTKSSSARKSGATRSSSGRTRKHHSNKSSSRKNIRTPSAKPSSSSSQQLSGSNDSNFKPNVEHTSGTKRKEPPPPHPPLSSNLPELVDDREKFIQDMKTCIETTLGTYFCKPETSNEEDQQSRLIDVLVEGFTRKLIAKIVKAAKECVDTMDGNWSKSGLYFFLETGKKEETKCGMTFGQMFRERLGKQEKRIAKDPMCFFLVDDAKRLIDDKLAQKVMETYSTPWHFHEDEMEDAITLIKLQILEGYCTVIWNFKKGVIFELLFQVPSQLVRVIFAKTIINKKVLQHLRAESMFFLCLTSSTLRNDIINASK